MLDIAPFSDAIGFAQSQKERMANAPQVHTPSTRYKSLVGVNRLISGGFKAVSPAELGAPHASG
jgi:hypothetical protein